MTPYTKNQPITRDFADRRPHNFEAESLICITLHPKRHLFQTKYAVIQQSYAVGPSLNALIGYINIAHTAVAAM